MRVSIYWGLLAKTSAVPQLLNGLKIRAVMKQLLFAKSSSLQCLLVFFLYLSLMVCTSSYAAEQQTVNANNKSALYIFYCPWYGNSRATNK
jgi:hypothetical protein